MKLNVRCSACRFSTANIVPNIVGLGCVAFGMVSLVVRSVVGSSWQKLVTGFRRGFVRWLPFNAGKAFLL